MRMSAWNKTIELNPFAVHYVEMCFFFKRRCWNFKWWKPSSSKENLLEEEIFFKDSSFPGSLWEMQPRGRERTEIQTEEWRKEEWMMTERQADVWGPPCLPTMLSSPPFPQLYVCLSPSFSLALFGFLLCSHLHIFLPVISYHSLSSSLCFCLSTCCQYTFTQFSVYIAALCVIALVLFHPTGVENLEISSLR